MECTLPKEFLDRMRLELGDEYDEFIESYNRSNYKGLRLNPIKLNDKLINVLKSRYSLRSVPWCKTGYYYGDDEKPGRDVLHHAGAYYIQEPSAMIVGELAGDIRNKKVLDLCAAPGGKTSHLAGIMNGTGLLVANEIIPKRAEILSQNVERMGIRNCIVTNESPDKLSNRFVNFFDCIVVDTPCSGEGMMRRDEIARLEWSMDNVRMCAQRGQDILENAHRMLKDGGRLVYSTCTFAHEEDEGAIELFISKHPEYRVQKETPDRSEGSLDRDGWPSNGNGCYGEMVYRLWPHRLNGEGHFAAVLIKGAVKEEQEEAPNRRRATPPKTNDRLKDFESFADELRIGIKTENIVTKADRLILVPEGGANLSGIRVIRPGLVLGENKKNRFEPDHALAMALRPEEFGTVLDIDSTAEEGMETCIKYLSGEPLSINNSTGGGAVKLYVDGVQNDNAKGWVLCCVDGISMGWGKINNGIIKNHYPKGLRIMR